MKKVFAYVFTMLLTFSLMITPCKAEGAVKQKYVDYKGVKIYTESYNYSPKAKEAVIFLHGLGGSYAHGKFLYDQSNPYMTITMDYLDHGNSGHVPTMSWDKHLESIEAVLDAYGIKKAHLVGHSFGADTAMMFAKKYPERVKDVILLDRAYYNYKDYEKFNLTENVLTTLEYDPQSGLSHDEFLQYMDMSWNNDITKTWDLNRDVLLLGGSANNFLANPVTGSPSLAGIIAMIKQNPSEFGIDPEAAKLLPNMTEDNVLDIYNFLRTKVSKFDSVNKRFSSIQTSYAHGDMVRNADAMNAMREYVIDYLTSENKHINKHEEKNNKKQEKNSVYQFNYFH
ncbi:alpha/beta fold hydrolase [Clostridium aciditolerans]|uniref:Alpha/beta hydrolase n=1 Tax=Clostridium aciditolerans TaxID=339861 RepID=A0A934M2L7_9CLOT|nr:alpha/beta hydrolase [Clostridium aciditolerans]MBI6872262.1 alpha/beta hydrolase [Clostridium aciditolerans]